ncbi:MAG: ABC transporter substrate-binding protein [Proteobacteria bacterium]|nr:ABC transporter substrate-binding protein [Pseudomonadota bacterium]MBU4383207.1 ABC transporter substrate-binding protein [Pseudomonadota bacterium]MBU4603511.1 ABC transporter substrate-binding protein [Pseudomonadota bacterium]MCG2764247.1 ABC transporter substrate-binding protein [Desulfarculaceae bacterium]
MKKLIALLAILTVAVVGMAAPAAAADKDFKLGVLFSLTGPFAPAGALAGYRGTMVAVDMINARGGIAGKYKVVPVVADAQSNPDVAIREGQRLMTVEKVPVVLGVFSSGIAVPLAPMADKNKKIFWVIIAISDKVVKDRNLKYVFRVQPMGSQWGQSTVKLLNDNFAKFGVKSAKDLKVAIIHEDGPYGSSVSAANKAMAKQFGMKVVLDEAYSHKTKDMSSLILKLKRTKPDAILHTGYFPDVVLFFRQARELGLKTKAIEGHGAGHANMPKLAEAAGGDLMNYCFNVDPAPAQMLDRKKLAPGTGELIGEFLKRYEEKFKVSNPPTHATQGFGHTWILLNDVAPLALKKYGDLSPESIRKASLEIDIPEGGTPCGYGVKFAQPGTPLSGQNLRSYPVVVQSINGKLGIAWPAALQTVTPVIPLPASSPFAEK